MWLPECYDLSHFFFSDLFHHLLYHVYSTYKYDKTGIVSFVELFVELITIVSLKKALRFSSLFERDRYILYGIRTGKIKWTVEAHSSENILESLNYGDSTLTVKLMSYCFIKRKFLSLQLIFRIDAYFGRCLFKFS